MEGFFDEKQIDLTLRLSPCGQNAKQEEKRLDSKVLMRFGDLQTMRRVRTGKRLLLEKQRRAAAAAAAAAEAEKSLAVSPPPLAHLIDKVKMHASPCGGSCHEEGEASFNVQTSHNQENNSLVSPPKAMQKMPPRPYDSKPESPLKKLKQVSFNGKSDAMDIMRKMPSVITTGEGPNGKIIEGLLYTYRKGQVCIVCVCHGSFFSPSEFVMHAGGKEVKDPMKHISVCSDSFCIKGDDGAGFITHPF